MSSWDRLWWEGYHTSTIQSYPDVHFFNTPTSVSYFDHKTRKYMNILSTAQDCKWCLLTSKFLSVRRSSFPKNNSQYQPQLHWAFQQPSPTKMASTVGFSSWCANYIKLQKKKQKSLENRGYMYHEKYEESIIEFQMLEKYTGEGFYSATLADMLWVQTQRVTDPLPDVDSIRRTPRMQFFRDWTPHLMRKAARRAIYKL